MSSGQRSHSPSSFKGLHLWLWILASVLLFSSALFISCAMPTQPAPTAPPSAPRPPHSHLGGNQANVLIFSGDSIWISEVDALADILLIHNVSYEEVTSAELNAMSIDQISHFGLIIVPGGDEPTLAKSLAPETHANLRKAVQELGISYLGFCAGAWAAISPAPPPGQDVAPYGLSIVDGPIQQFSYLEKTGQKFAISRAIFPDKSRRDLLWYGGPTTPDTPGGVIVRYADGTPAITQLWSKQGFVIVSGLHPAINAAILNVLGIDDPEAVDPDLAWDLINAGIQRTPLPAF